MESTAAATLALVLVAYFSALLWLRYDHDSQEPPLVAAKLPFLQPVLGIARKKNKYYTILKEQTQLPIYTLRMPASRIYVIASPQLITSVQKQYKALPHAPIGIKAVKKICGASERTNRILGENMSGEEGDWGYAQTYYKSIHSSMASGPGLDVMNRDMISRLNAQLHRDRFKERRTWQLLEWIRHEIAIATTAVVYGPLNPFPSFEEDFWAFEPNVLGLLISPCPSITAQESIRCRSRIAKEYQEYFDNNGPEKASLLLRTVFGISRNHGVPVSDIAKLEITSLIAILSNTVPTAFWLLYHIFSDAKVLQDCRLEVTALVEQSSTSDGRIIRTLDMARVKRESPILLSTFQEVLRHRSAGISVRYALKDHLLDNQYLLKEGSTIIMPNQIMHTDEKLWGSDVGSFRHQRFVADNMKRSHNPVAFRGFGGGKTLCPGRHFASTEILVLACIMMLRFDMQPVSGMWPEATTFKASIWATTPGPDEDIEVKVLPRADVEPNVEWVFVLSDSDKPIALSAEDILASQ